MTKLLKFSYGFTLIELLIVMTILSILGTVGAAVFNSVRTSAEDARKKADLNAIQKALEANYNPASRWNNA